MGNEVFRKDAVISAGGFNESLQVKEDHEMVWRLEKAGYKSIVDKKIVVRHNESQDRFTLKGHLKRSFNYGYWWHMLFYLHPMRVKFGGWPVKTLILIVLVPFFVLYPRLILLLLFGVIYLLYRRRWNISFCLGALKAKKLRVFILIILIETISALVFDLGKFYALFDKMRGKKS